MSNFNPIPLHIKCSSCSKNISRQHNKGKRMHVRHGQITGAHMQYSWTEQYNNEKCYLYSILLYIQ